jgi:hypothetical protein
MDEFCDEYIIRLMRLILKNMEEEKLFSPVWKLR